MLTGDNERTAKSIAQALGIDNVISGVRPDQKEARVRNFQAEGRRSSWLEMDKRCPALAAADVGIAIGSGTDVAKETGGIISSKTI